MGETYSQGHTSVLVVDDDPRMAGAVARRFRLEEDFQVYTISDVTGGSFRDRVVAFLESTRVDVLVTDVNLGDEIGFAIIHFIATAFRGSRHCPKFIVMTGKPENLDPKNGLLSHYPDVIPLIAAKHSKTADLAELVAKIRAIAPTPETKQHEKPTL